MLFMAAEGWVEGWSTGFSLAAGKRLRKYDRISYLKAVVWGFLSHGHLPRSDQELKLGTSLIAFSSAASRPLETAKPVDRV